MTDEQKTKNLRIIYGSLVILAIIFSCMGLIISHMSYRSLNREIQSLEIYTNEICVIQGDTLDKVKTNSENILLLHGKVKSTEEIISKIVETVGSDEINSINITDDNYNPDSENNIDKKPLWKRIIYFWNWCENSNN